MTVVYYPKIRPADYDLLQSVLRPDLPDSYDEGFDLARKEMRDIILQGDTPMEVEIDPEEFGRYCHAGRHVRTLDRLKQFAAEKGNGKSY